MATTAGKKTVLALHGFSQNATIFAKRLGALRRQCGKAVEFVFVDAPIILQPADLVESTLASASESQPASTLDALDATDAIETEQARAWFRWMPHKSEAVGLPESIEFLRDVLKSRHFDGVIGFSQGAGMAGFLAALLERPHAYPAFLVDGQPPHPPFEFCVAVSGFRLPGPIGDVVFSSNYTTPTLHIIGRNDVVVIEERSRQLVRASENARVEEHDGGHFVPSKADWRRFLAAYLQDPGGNVPSPASSLPTTTPGSSAGNSGTVTPATADASLNRL
ncbi:FSH1-domain-containing protein [Mycena pura]|uniref:FSH1-domain-containing protein n=1 Tax=Mycena pura TaxID=153505 RepID=A0AAD6YIN3_9AGAR|nr:FSH1-domain-containing protein [Mycena pura]